MTEAHKMNQFLATLDDHKLQETLATTARTGSYTTSYRQMIQHVVDHSSPVAQPQRRALPLDGEQKHAKHDEDGADNNASRQLLNPLQE